MSSRISAFFDEQDGRNLDLVAKCALEQLAHFGCGAGGVARVDDDPAVRGFDRVAARDAPATQGTDAVGDLLGDGGFRETPQGIGLELGSGRHGTVQRGDGFHGQRRAVPGSLRPSLSAAAHGIGSMGGGVRSECKHGEENGDVRLAEKHRGYLVTRNRTGCSASTWRQRTH